MMRALGRTGRKRGGYHRKLRREESLIRKLDVMKEEHEFFPGPDFSEPSVSPEKPRAHRFHFIEICEGSGKVTRALVRKGWTEGPVLDLDSSPYYDIRSPRILSIFFLLDEGLLDRFMVEPPCTILSPAQRPALRGYDVPRGYDLAEPRALEGTSCTCPDLQSCYPWSAWPS